MALVYSSIANILYRTSYQLLSGKKFFVFLEDSIMLYYLIITGKKIERYEVISDSNTPENSEVPL